MAESPVRVNPLPEDLEEKIYSIGEPIIDSSKKNKKISLDDRIFDICMKDPHTKTQLLRFVEVLPSLNSSKEVVKHFNEYLVEGNADFGNVNSLFKGFSKMDKLFPKFSSSLINFGARKMAKGFIASEDIHQTSKIVENQLNSGMGFSIDLLGEKTISEQDASNYLRNYFEILRVLSNNFGNDSKDEFGKPKINISVKASSLYPKYDPFNWHKSKEVVKSRLSKIFQEAQDLGAFVNVDTEHFQIKNLTNEIFKEVLLDERFRNYHDVGIVVQAYLKDSEETLKDFISWSYEEDRPMTIRLVKGAYWDYEMTLTQSSGWEESPVYGEKWESDQNYEKLTNILLSNNEQVGAAIASHNIRSISNALALKESYNLGNRNFEVQMLYGMAPEIKKSLVEKNIPLRVYTPYGNLIQGMGYFVRRLLENSSNESFLRSFDSDKKAKELLTKPGEGYYG